ncbi:type III secretion protein [Pseudomonas sp. MWU13-2625]|nr:type III secretion protein [Pseudomonas sp. MWU13-2625]
MLQSDSDYQTPANADLKPTLDLLLPIRRHRLTMAEQAWQRQRSVLSALHGRLEQLAGELRELRDQHQQGRIDQRDAHVNRRLLLTEMNQWLVGEQQALRKIERVEQSYQALQDEHRQQQQWTADSEQQLRRRQRDVEKLDYLRDLARDAS